MKSALKFSMVLLLIFSLIATASGCNTRHEGSQTESSSLSCDIPSDNSTEAPTDASTDALTEIPTDGKSESFTETPADTLTDAPTDNMTDAPKPENIVDLEKEIYTYDDMKADLEKLSAVYGEIFSFRSIAKTADGRDVYVAVVGSGKAPKQIVTDAGTHGRESLNPQAVMGVIEYYLSNYDTGMYNGKKISEILSDTDLYFIPMLNPDGTTISQLGVDGLLTEQVKAKVREIYDNQKALGKTSMSFAQYQYYWKSNAMGADINRNFPVEGNMTGNSGTSPSSSGYSPSPASESETVGYMELVNSLSNPVSAISVHSQGGIVYWDCGQKTAYEESRELSELICGVTGYYSYNYPSFTAATSDWAVIAKGIPSVTIETGTGTCPLPHSELKGIYLALRDVFLAVADAT